MTLLKRIEVANHTVYLEVLSLLELVEVCLSDLDLGLEGLGQWLGILALDRLAFTMHRGVQCLVSVLEYGVSIDTEVVLAVGSSCVTLGVNHLSWDRVNIQI